MDEFRKYLEQIDLAPRTVNLQEKHVKNWLGWLKVKVEDSSYKDLMNYIAHLQKKRKQFITSTNPYSRLAITISSEACRM